MKQIKVEFEKKDYKTEESFKTLRTNIMLSGVENKVIAITSCTPNEGKSTISLSLAKSLAESGKSVLLIDTDLRKSILAGKVTDNIKKAYYWLIEHTELEVDCWNVNYWEYGPSNIEDLKKEVNYYWNKNKK